MARRGQPDVPHHPKEPRGEHSDGGATFVLTLVAG
jgi:hypothetical protein